MIVSFNTTSGSSFPTSMELIDALAKADVGLRKVNIGIHGYDR
jgi:hypothetical protein